MLLSVFLSFFFFWSTCWLTLSSLWMRVLFAYVTWIKMSLLHTQKNEWTNGQNKLLNSKMRNPLASLNPRSYISKKTKLKKEKHFTMEFTFIFLLSSIGCKYKTYILLVINRIILQIVAWNNCTYKRVQQRLKTQMYEKRKPTQNIVYTVVLVHVHKCTHE